MAPIPFIGESLVLPCHRGSHRAWVDLLLLGGTRWLIVGGGHGPVQQVSRSSRRTRRVYKKTRIEDVEVERRGNIVGLNVIMMGPRVREGTQAGRFARERGLLKISTGDILREAIKEKNPTALAAQAKMDRGELVDDATIIAIVAGRLGRPDARPGFVLDGFPRTVAQAKALDELMARSDNGPLIVVDVEVRSRSWCGGSAAGASARVRAKR